MILFDPSFSAANVVVTQSNDTQQTYHKKVLSNDDSVPLYSI